ncbi:unnamed protein product [Alternaria alternata]
MDDNISASQTSFTALISHGSAFSSDTQRISPPYVPVQRLNPAVAVQMAPIAYDPHALTDTSISSPTALDVCQTPKASQDVFEAQDRTCDSPDSVCGTPSVIWTEPLGDHDLRSSPGHSAMRDQEILPSNDHSKHGNRNASRVPPTLSDALPENLTIRPTDPPNGGTSQSVQESNPYGLPVLFQAVQSEDAERSDVPGPVSMRCAEGRDKRLEVEPQPQAANTYILSQNTISKSASFGDLVQKIRFGQQIEDVGKHSSSTNRTRLPRMVSSNQPPKSFPKQPDVLLQKEKLKVKDFQDGMFQREQQKRPTGSVAKEFPDKLRKRFESSTKTMVLKHHQRKTMKKQKFKRGQGDGSQTMMHQHFSQLPFPSQVAEPAPPDGRRL